MAVVLQPDSLGSTDEAVIYLVNVDGKACLMLGMSRTGGIGICRSLTVTGYVVIVDLALIVV